MMIVNSLKLTEKVNKNNICFVNTWIFKCKWMNKVYFLAVLKHY